MCCTAECGECGDVGCSQRPGGMDECCAHSINSHGESCDDNEAPCVVGLASSQTIPSHFNWLGLDAFLQNMYHLDHKMLYLAVGLVGMLLVAFSFCIYWRVKRKHTYMKFEMVSDMSEDEEDLSMVSDM